MKTILLTRPEHQAEPFRSALEALGATVLLQPAIEIREPESWNDTDDAIRRILLPDEKTFDWIVFSSANGVDFFFDRLKHLRPGTKLPPTLRIAVAGPGTEAELRRQTERGADLVPDVFSAEGILDKLYGKNLAGKRFLLPRGNRGRSLLKRSLRDAGAVVTEISVYRSIDVDKPDPDIFEQMRRGEIDWVTATSPAVARSLVRMFGDVLRKARIVSISPLTSEALRELGFEPELESKDASMDGMLQVLRSSRSETQPKRET